MEFGNDFLGMTQILSVQQKVHLKCIHRIFSAWSASPEGGQELCGWLTYDGVFATDKLRAARAAAHGALRLRVGRLSLLSPFSFFLS